MRDLMNHIHVVRVLSPSAGPIDNTPQVGQIVDHQGFDSATYVIQTGTLAAAAASFTVLLEHGDQPNLADAIPVPDEELIGTEALASFTEADDNETRKLGYRGSKRYTRLTITPSGNTAAAPMSAVCILGHPSQWPTANPPQ